MLQECVVTLVSRERVLRKATMNERTKSLQVAKEAAYPHPSCTRAPPPLHILPAFNDGAVDDRQVANRKLELKRSLRRTSAVCFADVSCELALQF
jgi:hypothetical protein